MGLFDHDQADTSDPRSGGTDQERGPVWASPGDEPDNRPLMAPPVPPPAWPPLERPTPAEGLPAPAGSPAPGASRSGNRRAALVGGIAGAVVAALVATGVSVALDDDTSLNTERPGVTPVTTSDGGLDIQSILAKVQPSVVAVEASQSTSRGVFEGAGSGVVLSADGLVLTNAHVIGAIGEITVVLPDGQERPASLVGSSPDDDLAVIRVAGVDDLVPAELGSSDDLRVGDEVIAIGNALNLGADPTVTRGIVSAKDRNLTAEGISLEGLIQTDAAINRGNSGGPLVNAAGQVVGVNTAIVADAQNLGFAIAIDRARPIIEDLEAGGGAINADQPFLGVQTSEISDLTDDVRERFGVEVDEGAFVVEVVPGSAADEAGLEAGDVIVGVDGHEIEQATQVRDVILELEPGDRIELRILREGRERTLTATLGRRGDSS